jgi:hypothetical protein
MPHKTDPKSAIETDDTLARSVMENVKAEPIPAKIVELAEKLDQVLAEKRRKP